MDEKDFDMNMKGNEAYGTVHTTSRTRMQRNEAYGTLSTTQHEEDCYVVVS